MITSTGRNVWKDNGGFPSLYDIGKGLSGMPRFAFQTKKWYPVLAHVLVVGSIMPPEWSVFGLLHDAGESVVGDQVTTWKNQGTKDDEKSILTRICRSMQIEYPFSQDIQLSIDYADAAALQVEARVLGHFDPLHQGFGDHIDHPLAERLTEIYSTMSSDAWTKDGGAFGGAVYENAVISAIARYQVWIASRDLVEATPA